MSREAKDPVQRDLDSRRRAEEQRIAASKRAGRKAHKAATQVQKDVQQRGDAEKGRRKNG